MASVSFLLVAFSGVAFAAVPATEVEMKKEMVSVTVYFESYCPDSVGFLTKQLYPATQISSLMSHMNISLVPYGKAKTIKNGTSYDFECHHGEKECHGNKVLACALRDVPSADFAEKLKFVNCTSAIIAADKNRLEYPTNDCASNNLKPEELNVCAQGTKGSESLAYYGDITKELAPELTSVPTIVFNNKYVEAEHKLALTNFKQAFCDRLTMKPAECASSGNSATSLQAATVLPLFAAIAIAASRA